MINDAKILKRFFRHTSGIYAAVLMPLDHDAEYLKDCVETIVILGVFALEEVKKQKGLKNGKQN